MGSLLWTCTFDTTHTYRFFYDARGAIVRRVSNDKMSVSHRHGDLGELVAKIGPTGEAMDLTFQRCTNER